MADEITVNVRFSVVNGNYDPGTISVSNLLIDQSAVGCQEGVQNINTSGETLTSTNLTDHGWLYMRNLDATNFVEWGFTNTYGGKLLAGEPMLARTLANTTVYLKADTGACNVQYRWLEE